MRDLQAESLLAELEIEYTQATVGIADIDIERSHHNRGRVHSSLDQDVVDQYEGSLRAGADFPDIVLRRWNNSYVVIGGNHRLAAIRAVGRSDCSAIIVICDDFTFALLCGRLNQVVGHGTSTSERVEQAVELCRLYGVTVAEACAHMNVGETRVSKMLRVHAVKEQVLPRINGSAQRLTESHWDVIGKKSISTRLKVALTNSVIETNMPATELRNLTADLEQLGSEEECVNFLKQLKTLPKLPRSTKRTQFLGLTTRMEKLLANATIKKLRMNEDELPQLITRWQSLSKQILTLLNG